ncbi:MAG: hypothetical protein NC080_07600 [Paraprevotella sp.]|nr:hypothetical protein [Paraprevotella sp.]
MRLRAGLTIKQAADIVYVTWNAWWRWEQTRRHKSAIPHGMFELFMLKTGQAELSGSADASFSNTVDLGKTGTSGVRTVVYKKTASGEAVTIEKE